MIGKWGAVIVGLKRLTDETFPPFGVKGRRLIRGGKSKRDACGIFRKQSVSLLCRWEFQFNQRV
jgi:hypothetical protein